MKTKILSVLLLILACSGLGFGQNAADAQNVSGGVQVPFFVGGALEFGSGTGIGAQNERGAGIRNIEAMVGYWYPRLGFIRVGYGYSTFDEVDEKDDKYSVEHYDIDVELAAHVYGDLYLKGAYSRARDLSDIGDVAWNEWGLGFGSIILIMSKTMFFAEVDYRWVLDHFDPFLNKNVSGTRLQFNLGFAVYVY